MKINIDLKIVIKKSLLLKNYFIHSSFNYLPISRKVNSKKLKASFPFVAKLLEQTMKTCLTIRLNCYLLSSTRTESKFVFAILGPQFSPTSYLFCLFSVFFIRAPQVSRLKNIFSTDCWINGGNWGHIIYISILWNDNLRKMSMKCRGITFVHGRQVKQ